MVSRTQPSSPLCLWQCFLFGFENRFCQPRNALKLTLPQEYESLVESSQQYQHLDNPVYRVCIERAANAGVKDDLEIYPSPEALIYLQGTRRSAVSTTPQHSLYPSRSLQTNSHHPFTRTRKKTRTRRKKMMSGICGYTSM